MYISTSLDKKRVECEELAICAVQASRLCMLRGSVTSNARVVAVVNAACRMSDQKYRSAEMS